MTEYEEYIKYIIIGIILGQIIGFFRIDEYVTRIVMHFIHSINC